MRLSAKARDLTGLVFNSLTAIRPVGRNSSEQIIWRCACACGGLRNVVGAELTRNRVKCCGKCGRSMLNTHGHTSNVGGYYRSPEYHSYRSMLNRCYREKNHNYHDYGGRGIRVCKRWRGPRGFIHFLEDMGKRPVGMTLDRRRVNGNYTPSNCRWATAKTQARNRRPRVSV